MNHSEPYFLIDTNVWLDYYIPEREHHAEARAFIEQACELDAKLLYAVTTSKDLYYNFALYQKRFIRNHNKGVLTDADSQAVNVLSWGVIKNLKEFAYAVGCDNSDVLIAQKINRMHSDYEDNLVIAAAMRSKADYLVTNDEALLRHCPVASADISDAIKFIEIAKGEMGRK